MLRGTIDVQSEVGKGTEITIRVPLSRMAGTDTPISTPSTDASIDGGSQDDSMRVLQADYQAITVALYAFHSNECTNEMTEAGRMLKKCIEDWYGLRACSSLSGLTSKDLIIVDEKDLAELATRNAARLPTIITCSNTTRSEAISRQNIPVTEFVSKPFGPHKLAKALRLCLDKARDYHLGLTPTITSLSGDPNCSASEAEDVVPDMEHLTLETEDSLHPLSVQTNGTVTASESDNAQMAIDNCTADSSNGTSGDVTVTDGKDFPFPDQTGKSHTGTNHKSPRSPENQTVALCDRPLGDLTRRESRRPPLISRMTEPAVKTIFPHSIDLLLPESSAVTTHGEMATFGTEAPSSDAAKAHLLNTATSSSLTASNMALHNGESANLTPKTHPQKREKRPPRLLLVDDNKINLRLLETYMRKREYKLVDSAENGQLAVQAAESYEHGYDIIFMGE